MFEPWPAPAPVAMEEETYEKGYEAPTQSFPLQDQAYGAHPYSDQPGYQYGGGYDQGYQYPPHQGGQFGGAYPAEAMGAGMAGAGAGAMAAAAAMPANSAAAAAAGLQDGSMVRVKVAFVRSLEDELAISPGQQLYLHNAYDDGWGMCEDQNQNRGVVPLSCLEPWQEGVASEDSSVLETTANRRSSLHQN